MDLDFSGIDTMKGDCEDPMGNDLIGKYRRSDSQEQIKSLLSDLLAKEEEIATYRDRLKELEVAFQYNLDLISERDMELAVLEKQLSNGTTELKKLTQERDELEDLVEKMNERNCRKVQQLETRLILKEDEIKELQRENGKNVTQIKRILEETKKQQQMIHNLNKKYGTEKELHNNCREELEDKEKYFLLEIHNLSEKLEQKLLQARREKKEADEEKKSARLGMEQLGRLLEEKEAFYLEEIRNFRKNCAVKEDKEIQCLLKTQVMDRDIQVCQKLTESQKLLNCPEGEEHLKKRLAFLQEQNEVLKCVIKDLKRNREIDTCKPEENKGCKECYAIKTEVRQVNKNVETEINNFKKILEADHKQREEEEALIQSLEASVSCLKDKLLAGLQERLQDFSGEDISCTCSSGIQTQIQMTLLEDKLSKKIEAFMTAAEKERQKVSEKLEELKKECLEKMEDHMKSREEPSGAQSENLLDKIRTEIQKLENKIESDMKNMVENNIEKKFYKTVQVEPQRRSQPSEVLSSKRSTPKGTLGVFSDNYLPPENCIGVVKSFQRKTQGEGMKKLTNCEWLPAS